MKEWWNKYVKSSWIGLVAGIVIIALLLKIFALPAAMPFGVIFTWVAFFVGIPILWKKYGGQGIAEFWAKPLKTGVKIVICLFLYLLTRAYFTWVIGFTPLESWVKWTTETGTEAVFGYTPSKLLFEGVFLFVVGYLLVIKSVFDKKWLPRLTLTSFLVSCFLLQTFIFGAGAKVAETAKKPMAEEALNKAVEKDGVVGGMTKVFWTTAFGKTPAREWKGEIPLYTFDTGLAVKSGGKFYITTNKDFHLIQGDGRGGIIRVLIQGPVKNRVMTYSMGGGIWVEALSPETKIEIELN